MNDKDTYDGRCPLVGLIIIAVIIATVSLTVGLTVGMMITKAGPQTIIDMIAPTAAQASDEGWVNIAERL